MNQSTVVVRFTIWRRFKLVSFNERSFFLPQFVNGGDITAINTPICTFTALGSDYLDAVQLKGDRFFIFYYQHNYRGSERS